MFPFFIPAIPAIASGISLLAARFINDSIKDKVAQEVYLSTAEGAAKVRHTVRKNMTSMILCSVGRWAAYIISLWTIFYFCRKFGMDKDQLNLIIAVFIISFIYFYMILRTLRYSYLYFKFTNCRGYNKFMIISNLKNMVLQKIYFEVLTNIYKMPFYKRWLLEFYGPSPMCISSNILKKGIANRYAIGEIVLRMSLLLAGFYIYSMIYRSLFMYIVGIRFESIFQSVSWPFVRVLNSIDIL